MSRSDDEYRVFAMRGIFSDRPFIGVRIPQIRETVSKLPDDEKFEILNTKPIAIEEVLARGMIVAELGYEEMLKYFDSQVNYIDDWCTCDTFCSCLRKNIKKNREDFFEKKVDKLLQSKHEFEARVGIVILKCSYIDFDHLFMIFDRIENLADREEYYVKMALAWLIAECFIKFPEETLGFLKITKLSKWTYNKAISKICDSFRVEDKMKNDLRKMRK